MHTRVRAVLFAVTMLAAVCTFVLPSFAGIDDTWDWKDGKRKLKVHINPADADKMFGGKKLKDIVKEAMDNWNGVKDKTGWEFEAGTAADHDIEVKVGKSGAGGAHIAGFPTSNNKDRMVSKLTLFMDDKYKKGWGFNDDSKKNPVSAMKHELSHALRLDHQGGLRSHSKKIKDPQGDETAGDDVTTISDDDIKEAKDSSTRPIKTASAAVGPGVGATVSVPGFPHELPFPVITENAQLLIPSDLFAAPNKVTLSATFLRSMPDPLNVPAGLERMLKGVHISTQSPVQLVGTPGFFDVWIPFEDGFEGLGQLIDVSDPDWTKLIESSLRPFYYNHLEGIWFELDVWFSLDTTNDFLHMKVPSEYLNLAGTGDGLFLSIAGTPVPEPTTLVLFGTALAGLAGAMRKRSPRQGQ